MRGSQKALNREVSEENVCIFKNCNRCIKNGLEENEVGGREANWRLLQYPQGEMMRASAR